MRSKLNNSDPQIKTHFVGDDGTIINLDPIPIIIEKPKTESGKTVTTGTCLCDNGSACPGTQNGNIIDCTCCPEKKTVTDIYAN